VTRDLDEFTEFVAARSGALLRTAVLLSGGDRQHGEDLLQDALTETFRRWTRISAPQAREAYTRTILVRRATQIWRRTKLPSPTSEELLVWERAGTTRADPTEDLAVSLDVLSYLRDLPARQRAVVVLRYFDDLTEVEIARAMGCATGTVKSHASRALRTLRERLGDTAYGESHAREGRPQ
jgi:RNA polymerase sigma-70 factor, ECF subfamily